VKWCLDLDYLNQQFWIVVSIVSWKIKTFITTAIILITSFPSIRIHRRHCFTLQCYLAFSTHIHKWNQLPAFPQTFQINRKSLPTWNWMFIESECSRFSFELKEYPNSVILTYSITIRFNFFIIGIVFFNSLDKYFFPRYDLVYPGIFTTPVTRSIFLSGFHTYSNHEVLLIHR